MRGDRRQPHSTALNLRKRRRLLRPAELTRAAFAAPAIGFRAFCSAGLPPYSMPSPRCCKRTIPRNRQSPPPAAPSFSAAADAVPDYAPRRFLSRTDILLLCGVAVSALVSAVGAVIKRYIRPRHADGARVRAHRAHQGAHGGRAAAEHGRYA